MAIRRPSIRDVALRAGVSIATVSQTLSGNRPVSLVTRQRVLRAVADLGYSPNTSARSLRGGRSRLLGLTVTPIQGYGFHFTALEYYRHFINAATWAALARDYTVVLVPPGQAAAWDQLNVAGAIVVDPRIDDVSVTTLQARGVPLVTNGRNLLPGQNAPWVDNDNEAAARSVLAHFTEQGARHIALLSSPPTTSYALDCQAAYRKWCFEQRATPLIVVVENPNEMAGARAANSILGQSPRPDAILGTVDRLGLGALMAADELGIPIPDELLLATWSESEIRRGSEPFVTRVSDHPELAGSAAADMLIDLVEGELSQQASRVIPFELVVRPSSLRRPLRTGFG